MQEFRLWLEFEVVDQGNWNNQCEYCNIQVDLPDGRRFGINVWAYDFLQRAIQKDVVHMRNLGGLYLIPPDLFVKELTRDCIHKTINDLLAKGDLDKSLNRTVLAVSR